ncbi:MAG: DNA polymerase I [Bacteroidota bacterium]
MQEKKLFLLDAFALIYRAHFAFITRPLINSKGVNTSAITGFVRSLWDVMQNYGPTHIAVAFDLPGPTFRHEQFEAYKANREEQPEDITIAIPYIKKIIEGFNIPIVAAQGYEADDVIGTLAKQAEKEDFKVYMMTPDKDYAQLTSDNIFMFKPSRQGNGVDILDGKKVCEVWEIQRVDQVIDILGLAGDKVDNIPGIPGIGIKTAQKLLAQFDSVEGIIANTDQLKGKQKERVIEHADDAILSKQLATINVEAPVKFDEEEYRIVPVNKEALRTIFGELEFRTLTRSILGEDIPQPGEQTDLFGNVVGKKSGQSKPTPQAAYQSHIASKNIDNTPHTYTLVNSAAERADLIRMMMDEKSICFDTETTGIDANQAELVGLAFSWKAHEGYYVPISENQEEARNIVAEFKPVLENADIEKIGQNIKYDVLMMKWYGIEIKGTYFDTMIAHYLCEPDLRHKLDYLTESYLQYSMVPIETLIGKRGKNQLSMRDVPIEKAADYAAEDADLTFQLKEPMEKLLKEAEIIDLFNDLEIPLVNVLVDMEYEGVRINADFLNAYSKELGQKIIEKEQSIHREAGVQFNIASPKQVGEILFDKMKIPYRWAKTKTGQYSTNEEKLTELALQHEFVNTILEYRKLTKLKSTYVDALPTMINPKTNRVHSSFNQARAATGRLSSENPNLQNIPIRDEAGRHIRKAFEPRDENHILLAADYSQIELRVIAHISNDEAMIESFNAGHDIHQATAANVYGVALDEVTKDQRRNAKTVNFSIIYGAGATNLSRQLDIKRAEAKELIEQYFKQYQGLKNYMESTVEFARENGYVTTLLGRRRFLRDINSKNSLIRSNAERVAINTPIQGTAADMIKVAMINIHKALKEGNFKTKMIMQVHDELVFDVPKDEIETVEPIIRDLMKNAIPDLKVPIIVGIDTGNNWLEAH